MRVRNNPLRVAVLAVTIVALMLPGMGNLVIAGTAPPIVPVETSGTNVCTGEMTASYAGSSTSPTNTLDLVWNGTTLTYPTTSLTGLTLTYKIWSQGPPGDRNCRFSSSNTAFVNGAVQLLPADALRQVGTANYTISNISATSRTVPLVPGDPVASVSTGSYAFRVDTTGVNNLAPVGVYTSTLTLTVSTAAP
jgi:hypothetical protein